jgi:hypothetical protein
MIDLKAEAQRFLLELRTTRWRTAIIYSTVAGVVGLGSWVVTHYFFVAREPPEYKAFSERAADGVPMADFFLSYEPIADVEAKLTYEQLRAEHTASHKPPSRHYPPRDLDTLEVDGFTHLGQRGKITLEFFNDRLYEARFEPEELRGYVKRLHAEHPELQRDRTGNIDVTIGNRHVASNVDLAASKVGSALNLRPFVIWQDLRLKQQLKLWEDTYGPASVRSEK